MIAGRQFRQTRAGYHAALQKAKAAVAEPSRVGCVFPGLTLGDRGGDRLAGAGIGGADPAETPVDARGRDRIEGDDELLGAPAPVGRGQEKALFYGCLLYTSRCV